jgi:hypothetical protein
MAAAGFERTIPANERPQTHTLDRAATGIHLTDFMLEKVQSSRKRPVVAQKIPGGLGSQNFHDILHVKVVRLSDSRTGRLYPKEMFLVLIFIRV